MTGTATLTVRYFAAARSAAGIDTEKVQVATTATVDELLDAIRAQHGPELSGVLERCSFLLDEVAVRDRTAPLGTASTLDVLPPFAGG